MTLIEVKEDRWCCEGSRRLEGQARWADALWSEQCESPALLAQMLPLLQRERSLSGLCGWRNGEDCALIINGSRASVRLTRTWRALQECLLLEGSGGPVGQCPGSLPALLSAEDLQRLEPWGCRGADAVRTSSPSWGRLVLGWTGSPRPPQPNDCVPLSLHRHKGLVLCSFVRLTASHSHCSLQWWSRLFPRLLPIWLFHNRKQSAMAVMLERQNFYFLFGLWGEHLNEAIFWNNF